MYKSSRSAENAPCKNRILALYAAPIRIKQNHFCCEMIDYLKRALRYYLYQLLVDRFCPLRYFSNQPYVITFKRLVAMWLCFARRSRSELDDVISSDVSPWFCRALSLSLFLRLSLSLTVCERESVCWWENLRLFETLE